MEMQERRTNTSSTLLQDGWSPEATGDHPNKPPTLLQDRTCREDDNTMPALVFMGQADPTLYSAVSSGDLRRG